MSLMQTPPDDGLDLSTVGNPPSTDPAPDVIEKEITRKFRFRNKEWSVRIVALDAGRRQRLQRAEVALADSVPFDRLSVGAQSRIRALAMVTACTEGLPKDLSAIVQTWDEVLYSLYEIVEAHSDAYFQSLFGPREDEAGAAD